MQQGDIFENLLEKAQYWFGKNSSILLSWPLGAPVLTFLGTCRANQHAGSQSRTLCSSWMTRCNKYCGRSSVGLILGQFGDCRRGCQSGWQKCLGGRSRALCNFFGCISNSVVEVLKWTLHWSATLGTDPHRVTPQLRRFRSLQHKIVDYIC